MTQKGRIIRHLLDYNNITSWEAFKDYGITRLSGIIYILKKEGYIFTDEWLDTINRYGEPTRFKKYILFGFESKLL